MSIFRAKTLAKLLGCDPSLSSSVLEVCMQKANASAIVQMQFGVFKQPGSGITPFLVVIDGVFLPDTLDVCFSLTLHFTFFFLTTFETQK